MLFDAAHTDDLKAWLTAELGPICDADPEVLSDYVLALLKHEASEAELRKLLKEQLEDFLAAETDGFVDRTFAALTSKAYLPGDADVGPSTVAAGSGQPNQDTPESSRKRRADDETERSSPPRQSRRLDESSPSARNGEKRPAIYDEPLDVRPRDGPRGRDGRKQMCRDYHNNGYCSRGANCKFEHSTDMLPGMPGMSGPMPMGQFPPGMGPMMGQMRPGQPPMMFPGGPGFGMPPHGWAPPPGSNGGFQGGPGSPASGGGDGSLSSRLGAQVPGGPEGVAGSGFNPDASAFMPGAMPGLPHGGGQGAGGGRGGHGAGRGRGRGGAPGQFQSNRRSNTTLVIENVPAEHLDLIKVNEFFKKFGTITNISIDAPASKALVSFSQPQEAKAAHESPEVIFGNRFVKVYFQRLDEPLQSGGAGGGPFHGHHKGSGAGPSGPPAPKPNFAPGQNVYHARPPVAAAAGAGGSGGAVSEERRKLLEEQKARQEQLDAQLAEQKALLAKLSDKDVPAEERKSTMMALKKLGEDIKASTEAAKAAVAALAAAPADRGHKEMDSQAWRQEKEKREKEQLDRELELHSKGASPPGSTTDELRKKLESLKAEAASLGIDGSGGYGGGARGRGRGGFVSRGAGARGGYGFGRGRGGMAAQRSMRLDNRTTRLKITELPAGVDQDKVQEHLKKFGEVDSFTDAEGDSLTVAYKTRASAEQALRAGAEIPEIGTVKMAWVQQPASATAAAPAAPAAPAAGGSELNGGEEEYEESDRDSSWKR